MRLCSQLSKIKTEILSLPNSRGLSFNVMLSTCTGVAADSGGGERVGNVIKKTVIKFWNT